MERTSRTRALGGGYRAKIRELDALGMTRVEILEAMPGLRASELDLTLSVSRRRGRPPKLPTITSLEAAKRWRSTQRPRTLRAAIECLDFLLEHLDRLQNHGVVEQEKPRGRHYLALVEAPEHLAVGP